MGFSEKIKEKVKQRSHFKCCLCHEHWATHVHHIIPEAEDGSNAEENAAPLCPTCHDLYGGNPDKRKFIEQSRDFYYKFCEKRSKTDTELNQEILDHVKELTTKDDLKNAVQFMVNKFDVITNQSTSTASMAQQISDASAAFSLATFAIIQCKRCGSVVDVSKSEKCPNCGFLTFY